jgi:hypothetical protein
MSSLDTLPSDLLSRLDQALPLFTQAAIHGEYLHGVWLVCVGGVLMLGSLLYGAITLRVPPLAVIVSLLGAVAVCVGWPSVVAPEAILARELIVGLGK